MVYYITLEKLSFTKFGTMCKFFEYMDFKVDILHYQHRTAFLSFLKAISQVTVFLTEY